MRNKLLGRDMSRTGDNYRLWIGPLRFLSGLKTAVDVFPGRTPGEDRRARINARLVNREGVAAVGLAVFVLDCQVPFRLPGLPGRARVIATRLDWNPVG